MSQYSQHLSLVGAILSFVAYGMQSRWGASSRAYNGVVCLACILLAYVSIQQWNLGFILLNVFSAVIAAIRYVGVK